MDISTNPEPISQLQAPIISNTSSSNTPPSHHISLLPRYPPPPPKPPSPPPPSSHLFHPPPPPLISLTPQSAINMYRNKDHKLSWSWNRLIVNMVPNFANNSKDDVELSPTQQDDLFRFQLAQPDPRVLAEQSFYVAGVVGRWWIECALVAGRDWGLCCFYLTAMTMGLSRFRAALANSFLSPLAHL